MTDSARDQTFVIGTAGHIDHGKSTLVKALTGTDPDRLAEEKARGMTIDLGFAWLRSPAGKSISIVDVPGHERFIKNMLAGVGGIDAALLVIAADEGPMPQTDEHLAILDLLDVRTGVVALSKSDLVDPDWLDLVAEEVKERIAGTTLSDAPIIAVSATTGAGIPELLSAIDASLVRGGSATAATRPRLAIDRVFTVQGFGTVVTGTLIGGSLVVGQALTVMPRGLSTRVRGLQTHSQKVDSAQPGSRVAVNLTGLDVADMRRGDVLTVPEALKTTQRIDVQLRLLPDSPIALEQNDQVDFFSGAMELPAWVTLLDREKLAPSDVGWVQLRFREQLALLRGDRFIIRRPSPSLTIGGGLVIDATPVRHRRFRPEVLTALEVLATGTPDELVLQALEAGPLDGKTLRAALTAGISDVDLAAAIELLGAEGDLVTIGPVYGEIRSESFNANNLYISTTAWIALKDRLTSILQAFHRTFPLRKGMPREELKQRLELPRTGRLGDQLLSFAQSSGVIAGDGATAKLPEFRIALEPATRQTADAFLRALREIPFAPPSPSESGLDAETLGALEDLGEIVKVADGVVYDPDAYAEIERQVLEMLDRDGSITIASYRDHFQTSRKYAQATLEYLDKQRITRRVGDERVRYAGHDARSSHGSTE